jgi:GDP-L-fucose synthase
MNSNSKIFVAGHNGMVGSRLINLLKEEGFNNLVFADRKDLDLTDLARVEDFFNNQQPQIVVLAAAKVGGIIANINYPVDFLIDNLRIQNNIISCANKFNVEKLVFIASSCIYPVEATIPISEEQLLTGKLEETNKYYAIAKIAGISLCEAYNKQYSNNFISILPTNLYGPGDNFNLLNGHVLPSLLRKFYEAKINKYDSVEVWGTGKSFREFLHVDDLASAILHLLRAEKLEHSIYNIGFGSDISIADLSSMIGRIIGYSGGIIFNKKMPDGVKRKLLDSSRIREIGWAPQISLEEGIKNLYKDYSINSSSYRG